MDPEGRFKRPLAWVAGRSPSLHRFLTSEARPHRWGRELASVALVVILVLGSVYVFSGQSLDQPPVVVVESGSMMHCENGRGSSFQGDACGSDRFGRLGTIDPGDVVIVRDVDDRGDVSTFAGSGRVRYGFPGDVLIYQPLGDPARTPIIHRALFWVEMHPDGTVSVPAADLHRARPDDLTREQFRDLGVPESGIGSARTLLQDGQRACRFVLDPDHPDPNMTVQGFVTGGDNNGVVDGEDIMGTNCPVQVDWILGEARGEIPWIGLLKLRFTDPFHYQQAPGDLRGLMWGSVALILFGPFAVDMAVQGVRRLRGRKDE